MLAHPVTLVLAVLAAAALCFALGTFRGSWRVWLIGYALTVAALALSFAGVHNARRAVPSEPPTGVTANVPAPADAGPSGRAGGSTGAASSDVPASAELRR